MDSYDRLQVALTADLIVRGQEENEAAKAIYQHVLDAIWPEIERMCIAEEVLRSESFLWLMTGASENWVHSHIDTLRPAFQAWVEKGGEPWGKSRA